DGIRDFHVTGVQTCALPIYRFKPAVRRPAPRKSAAKNFFLPAGANRGNALAKGVSANRGEKKFLRDLLTRRTMCAIIDSEERGQIGRASCRERVKVEVVAGW